MCVELNLDRAQVEVSKRHLSRQTFWKILNKYFLAIGVPCLHDGLVVITRTTICDGLIFVYTNNCI